MRSRVLFIAILLVSVSPSAEAVVVPVTPASSAGWQLNGGPRLCPTSIFPSTGSFTFMAGPATPPLGSGSVRFDVGANPDSAIVNLSSALDGVLLRDITELRYSTFVSAALSHAVSQQAPRLFLFVDVNGDQTQFRQMVFIPRLQGPVLLGAWQTWDALAGGWWDFSGPPSNPPLFQLPAFAAAHPAAVVSPLQQAGFAVLVGCDNGSWAGFSGNIDAVSVGVRGAVTTYDFETVSIPATQPIALLVIAAALLGVGILRLR